MTFLRESGLQIRLKVLRESRWRACTKFLNKKSQTFRSRLWHKLKVEKTWNFGRANLIFFTAKLN